ncbi:MAG: endonuclease/exonuclease/phosphatase family protein, partial [Gemmatimonadota bacterium]|nr:endonuclease/exonuclease/phosphatase family protein [Gemmatimonadota bacterium]
ATPPRRRRASPAGAPRRAPLACWVRWLSWGYLGLALVAWLAVWVLAERWWPATVYLFGPRWLVILPLALLIPAAVLLDRRSLAPLGLAGIVVLFPVLGLCAAGLPGAAGKRSPDDLRVVTLNAAGRPEVAAKLAPLLAEWRPDIVAVQECGPLLDGGASALPGWHAHAEGGLCLLSRYPIRAAVPMNRDAFAEVRERGLGGSGGAVRYLLEAPGRPLRLANVHLETPRKGLEGVRFRLGAGRMAENTMLREMESRQVFRWVGPEEASLVVAGDFNMPVESRIYRATWGTLTNAFSAAGWGFGRTRDNGWIQVRIDHVLAGSGWRVRRAWVGPDVGSDHRPVVADLRRREER